MSAPKTCSALIQTAQDRSDNAYDGFQLIASNDTEMAFQDKFTFTKHIDYRKTFESHIKILYRVASHAKT
ncbi:MAG: hypothetical protein KGI09_01730 [Thaumarchaeota archaeon]|nr:hypothetical protein [Nitrososphaerota archaeon]